MTPIEIFALLFSAAVLIKILILIVNPGRWFKLVKKVYSYPLLIELGCIVLAGIVLHYLLQSLTFIQIGAVMLFTGLLGGITASSYSKEILSLAKKIMSKKKIKKAWLSIIIWVVLAGWILWILFF
jgi:hypothetical protein